jgi:hypothetical protein
VADDDQPRTKPRLRAGTRVEARSGLDGAWQPGFTVAEVTATGYRLRRDTDGAVLPELLAERVRRERKRETWWV